MALDMKTRVVDICIVAGVTSPSDVGIEKKVSLFNERNVADSRLYNADTAGLIVAADGAGNEVLTVSLDPKSSVTRYRNQLYANASL